MMKIKLPIKYIIIILLFVSSKAFSANIDSLEKVLSVADEKSKIEIYNSIAKHYLEYNIDSSLTFAQLSMDNAVKYDDKIHIADNNYLLAYLNEISSKNANAVRYYETAIELYIKLKNKNKIAECYNGIGSIYNQLGDYEQTLENYIKALEIYEELGDKEGLAIANNNIGIVYKTFGNYQLALEKYNLALSLFTELNDTNQITGVLSNIGLIYYYERKYDSALVFFNQSLNLLHNDETKPQTAAIYHNIGNIYKNRLQYYTALDYYFRALEIKKNTHNKNSTCNTITCIGETYFYMGNYDLAEEYLNESIELAQLENLREILKNNYMILAQVYKKTDNYKEAMHCFEKYALLNDTIFNKEMTRKIAEFQMNKEIASTQKKIQSIKSEKEAREQTIIILFISIIIVLTLSVMLFFRYKEKNHLNKLLSEKNSKLLESENNLRELNATKDKFFSIIAHDLKNPLGSLKQVSDLFNEIYDEISEEEKRDFISEMKHATNSVYNLLENLLTWSRLQRGIIPNNPINFDLSFVISDVADVFKISFTNKNIRFEQKTDSKEEVYADVNMITAVIRNLVSNAIKFTPENGSICVKTSKNEKYIEVEVKDSGMGISPENLKKLFRIDQSVSTVGTNDEKGTGLGLILCKEFIEKNGGKIKVETTVGQGSSFIFTLPLHT